MRTQGDVAKLRAYLAKSKVSPDVRDKDMWTATHWAAFNDHADAIVELKNSGANISAVDAFGEREKERRRSVGERKTEEVCVCVRAEEIKRVMPREWKRGRERKSERKGERERERERTRERE